MTKARFLLSLFFILVSCSPTASKQYLTPYVPPNKIVDMNSEAFDPKADILFVVDNSGSMSTHQLNLANNISLFTSVFLKNSILSYNIAVISTDSEGPVHPWGGMFNGSIKVVNNQTPNANVILGNNFRMGTSGSAWERMFDPVYMALSEPLISGWNAGFLRKDATLIVIFITDAEDQSEMHPDPNELHQFLVGLKGGDVRKVMAFGAIVPTGVDDCSRDAWDPPARVEEFLALVQPNKSNVLNLCDPDYGTRLAKFASDIVSQVSSNIYLSRSPVLSSIKVMYGNIELPRDFDKGWSFDAAKNAIHLGSKIDWTQQPPGSRVNVYYDAARFDEE